MLGLNQRIRNFIRLNMLGEKESTRNVLNLILISSYELAMKQWLLKLKVTKKYLNRLMKTKRNIRQQKSILKLLISITYSFQNIMIMRLLNFPSTCKHVNISISFQTGSVNINQLWEGYPHTNMVFIVKFYFVTQIAYWLHCFPELYFQKVKRVRIKLILYCQLHI